MNEEELRSDSEEARRRMSNDCKDEARALRMRLGRYLQTYGGTGNQMLTWGEEQELTAAENSLRAIEHREVK